MCKVSEKSNITDYLFKIFQKSLIHIHSTSSGNSIVRERRLRKEWNERYGEGNDPVVINSGYRCQEVNRLVGGCATSNHLTGCAADIRVMGKEQLLRYVTILLDISDTMHQDFDELLIERNARVYWLHFAVRPQNNRRKILLINVI